MTTTLLRRYFFKPGGWEGFLETWRRIVLLRKRHGFKVQFAFEDREKKVFTWSVSHDGNIDEVAKKYYADPDLVALETVGNMSLTTKSRP
jgi:hypothetical protein